MSWETGRTLRVVLKAHAGTEEQVNVLHYDANDGGVANIGANNPQSLADFFRDNVMNLVAANFTAGWSIDPVIVEEELDPKNPTAPRQAWTSGGILQGGKVASSDVLPSALCVVYRLDSDRIGRRYNGRLFAMGSRHEADQAAGSWTTTYLTDQGRYVNAIPHQPDISGPGSEATCNWAVYSRTNRSQGISTYLAHIQTPIVRSRLHWLRSRDS